MRLRSLFGVVCCVMLLARIAHAEDGACASPRQMDGFQTCADVAKAEDEGAVVLYSTDPEIAQQTLLAAFHAAFPKIKASYLRLQAGALYAKLLAERQGRVYSADVLQIVGPRVRRRFPEARRLHALRVAGDGRLQAGI